MYLFLCSISFETKDKSIRLSWKIWSSAIAAVVWMWNLETGYWSPHRHLCSHIVRAFLVEWFLIQSWNEKNIVFVWWSKCAELKGRWCFPSFFPLPTPTPFFITRLIGSSKLSSSLSIAGLFGLKGCLSAKWCVCGSALSASNAGLRSYLPKTFMKVHFYSDWDV